MDWILIHWFELSTLVLLFLNLWFVTAVLSTLRETNRWLSFLSNIEWDKPAIAGHQTIAELSSGHRRWPHSLSP